MAAPDITAALARTLQALRAERGWSLDQLAARSGVSKGVLVSLEQGRSNPNLATLARVGDAFGVPMTRLVEVTGESSVRITGPESRRGCSGAARPAGPGTIIAATDAALGGGAVALDAPAGRGLRRRRAHARHPGAGLGGGAAR